MNRIAAYALQRLSERSTWVGLTGVVTAFGVTLAPMHATAISVVGAFVASVIQVVVRDHKPFLIAVEEVLTPDIPADPPEASGTESSPTAG